MAKRYRIHPGLGIARIGNSPTDYFLAAEIPGGSPLELGTGAQEIALAHYKDAQGRLKRQGARFRIYEYETDAAGERVVREITAAEATISWTVQLANTKAAGKSLSDNGGQGQILYPDGPLRNLDANRADLAITPTLPPISGANQNQLEAPSGRFRGKGVKIGELKTDAAGRLIVLGGHGVSESYPAVSPIVTFANNPDWHDDVADGSVDATITFAGEAPIAAEGSWIVIAPPDFAPPVQGLATIYDVALSAVAEGHWPPGPPSYQQDILPILRRALALRWTQKYPYWNSFPKAFDVLGAKGAAGDAARATAYAKLIDVEASHRLLNFHFTRLQRQHLDDWKAGNFKDDYDPAPPVPVAGPANLDRAALEPCVGGGWYPGIEAGVLLTNPALWSELCRPTRAVFTDRGAQVTPGPGYLTERMACPWQADFFDCEGAWWPAQRPDKVFKGLPPASTAQDWSAGIQDHEDLVANFWKLGLLTPSGNGADGLPAYLETERDPSLPHAV